MKVARRWQSMALLAVSLALAAPARGEAAATLSAAEKAYAEVDFERTHDLAQAALRQGGHDPEESKRLYALLGISAAALEREDEAREAFRRVLAIDPGVRLDQNLSPKMRGPYLEARGELSAAGGGRPLGARLERDGDGFAIELDAAAQVAHSLELEVWGPGEARPRMLSFEAHPRTPVGQAAGLPESFEYALSVRDEYGNRLFRMTGSVAPVAPPPRASEVLAHAERAPVRELAEPNRAPYFVTAGVLAAFGVGAVGAGVVAQLRREDAAEEWNSASCEVPGQTRGEQCESVDSKRQSAENWAIGLYTAGGTLIIGSLITLALTPRSRSQRPSQGLLLPCVPSFGPDRLAGATCRARF